MTRRKFENTLSQIDTDRQGHRVTARYQLARANTYLIAGRDTRLVLGRVGRVADRKHARRADHLVGAIHRDEALSAERH